MDKDHIWVLTVFFICTLRFIWRVVELVYKSVRHLSCRYKTLIDFRIIILYWHIKMERWLQGTSADNYLSVNLFNILQKSCFSAFFIIDSAWEGWAALSEKILRMAVVEIAVDHVTTNSPIGVQVGRDVLTQLLWFPLTCGINCSIRSGITALFNCICDI